MKFVIVGAQWGDEGKGKIVDFLADRADTIIRYSGGANAGHTIVSNGITYKLHLVPSGIVYPGKTVILGSGMVIDPEALFDELETLSNLHIQWERRIFISERAHLVLPGYKELDKQADKERDHPLGTTGRGIGVSYAMKSSREGIRIVDLLESRTIDSLNEKDRQFLLSFRDQLKPMVIDLTHYLMNHKNEHLLFEGAQGVLLDLDVGTYPYVSSGNSTASGAAVGGGIGPQCFDKIIGVFKAYSTRVGNGPFPTEFDPDRDGNVGEIIREIGREYGVTTGRPRRCGYLDLVALKYACFVSSIDSLALTHIDVYDTFDEISVCTGYKINGSEVSHFPASIEKLEHAKPILKTFTGWKTPLGECRSYEQLPSEARKYIDFIESFVETPIDIISVGYERNQTIMRRSPWTQS